MKDYALELAAKQTSLNGKLNIVREYLQAYILRIMHAEAVFRATAFVGGTALRFLYGLPRFSQDLDFSAHGKQRYSFTALVKKIKEELNSSGYSVSVTSDETKTVQNSFIKIEGLLYEAGISPLKTQKFSIKLEIDTNPPGGAVFKTELVNKYFPIAFLSYDIPSLFAGKLHALLSRKYSKGRDFFDLGWYISKWKGLCPNLVLLNNALKQTAWSGPDVTETNWKELIYKVVESVDWKKIERDVQSFLENPADFKALTQENILHLLE